MLRFVILCLFMLLCFFQNNSAKDTTEINDKADEVPRHYIGASVSSISSLGISYHFLEKRKNPTDAFKFTFGLLPDLYDSKIWVFFGAEFQTSIYQNDFSRLYWLIGAGYESLYISGGTGVGYELYSGKPGIAINLDLGISLLKEIPNPYASRGTYGIEFAPGIGLGLSYAY
ncbi:MAG: hypothetical protein V1779_02210 [bacterium]